MTNSYIPQYVKIKSYLREAVEKLQPHDKIPSENELAKTFGVSRGTAKQAIMDLVYEGVLYREQGKGTFVSSRMSRSFDKYLPSLAEDIRKSGHVPSCTPLQFLKDAPAPRARAFFGTDDSMGILCYKRLVHDNGEPVALIKSFLNPAIYGGLKPDIFNSFLYETLDKTIGKVPAKAKDLYRFAEISPNTAQLLKCRSDDYVCYCERKAYLEDGTPAEYVESWIKASFFKLEVSFGL